MILLATNNRKSDWQRLKQVQVYFSFKSKSLKTGDSRHDAGSQQWHEEPRFFPYFCSNTLEQSNVLQWILHFSALFWPPKHKIWRRKWKPTPVFLPGESHVWRRLVGYSPWGRRVRHDWTTSLSFLKHKIVMWEAIRSLLLTFLWPKLYLMQTLDQPLAKQNGFQIMSPSLGRWDAVVKEEWKVAARKAYSRVCLSFASLRYL